MMARELDAPLGVAGIQLEVGQMSGDADAEDKGFEQFERFLEHWSRRDFLKRTGGVAAYMAFAAGGLSFLEACGGGTTSTSLTPKKGGHVIEGNFSDIRTLNSMLSSDTASNQVIGLMFDGLLNYAKSGDLVPQLAKSLPTTPSTSPASPPPIRRRSSSRPRPCSRRSSPTTRSTASCPSTCSAAWTRRRSTPPTSTPLLR